MNALVSSNDIATDVTGAEALIERHQEHRAEIDARAGTFENFDAFGQELLNTKHYASPDIEERLKATRVAKEDLLK